MRYAIPLALSLLLAAAPLSAAGTVTRNDEPVERRIETRLGNSALIGVCIYFK